MHLLLHHLRSENHHFCCRMFDFKFSDDCGRIVCYEQLFQVIDHHLVHSIRAVGCRHSVGELFASI